MSKKFTMLLASLFLVMGTAWAQDWLQPKVSTGEEVYEYYIRNYRDQDYYATTTKGLNGGEQQLGSANAFTEEKAKVKFKLVEGGKLYSTNTETSLILGYTTTGEAAKSVQLFVADNSYTWKIESANGGHTLSAGDSNNSWNMHGGKGADIGLYRKTDAGSNWVFVPANDKAIAAAETVRDKYTPSTEVYYQIKNVGRSTFMASDGNQAIVAFEDDAVDSQLWAFEKGTDGLLYLRNGGGKYLGHKTSNNQVWPMTDTENKTAFEVDILNTTTENYYIKYQGGNYQSCAHDAGWNDRVDRIVRWEPAAEASQWYLQPTEISVDARKISFTYSLQFDGVERSAQSCTAIVGANYPNVTTALPFGITATKPQGKVTEAIEGTTIKIELTENMPFIAADSYDNIEHWYYMSIDNKNKYYLFYEEGDEAMAIQDKKSVNAEKKNEYTWAFVGNNFDGYKIVNYAAGKDMILSASTTMEGSEGGNSYPVLTQVTNEGNAPDGKNTYWIASKSTHDANGFFLEQKEILSNKMNFREPNLAFWTGGTGEGSTFLVSERGVFDEKHLKTTNVYALQAERAPLLYIDQNEKRDKLASTFGTDIATEPNNPNQQFLILRSEDTPAGSYYLYSVGAKKFVDANLTFTDYAAPVLTLEKYNPENENNKQKTVYYHWWVKINNKYVITGNGTAGHNLHHVPEGDDDEGKRYRILNVGTYDASAALEKIRIAENTVKAASELSNDKVYTVTPADNATTGVWDVKYENDNATMLAITKFTDNAIDPTSKNQQFAFLKANGEYYLYSYGAEKFVAKNGNGQKLTGDLSEACRVEFLNSTISSNQAAYPLVVKVGGSQLHSSYQNHLSGQGGIITSWDHTESGGNAVAIVPVDGTIDLSAAVAKIETYQLQREKAILDGLIGEANTLVGKEYIGATGKETLNAAITAAQDVYNNSTDFNQVKAQITSLTNTINEVAYVVDPTEFSNNAIYTFLSNRNATAYMMYDADTPDYVASKYMKTTLEAGDDQVNCHWAVYKSEKGNYYMYNLGAGKFMGTESAADTGIPFSETPQTTTLKFGKSDQIAGYPIMISSDGGNGAINHSNNAHGGKNKAGIINWAGGFSHTEDPGNVHKVAIVGELEESTLKTIREAVELYETQGVAIQELEIALTDAARLVQYNSEDLGHYGSKEENLPARIEAFYNFKRNITEETTAAEIQAQTALINEIIASFKVNLPQTGKFYRFSYDYGADGVKYVQAVASNVSGKANAMVMTADDEGAASIFYYDGGENAESADDDKLLSYSAGQYVSEHDGTRGLQPVGGEAGKTSFAAGSEVGKLYITVQHTFHANKDGEIYFVDHCPTQNAHAQHNFIVEEVTTLPVAIGQTGHATFYTPVAVKIDADVTASIITKTDIKDNEVSLDNTINSEEVVPAGTGLILQGEEGVYDFVITTEGTVANVDGNLLTGATAKSLINPETEHNGKPCYILAVGSKGVGLYKAKADKNANGGDGETHFMNNANKAYLPYIPEEEGTGEQPAPAMFSFGRGGEGTTSIEDAELANDNGQLTIYDLTGRRIEKIAEKGIYIVNGKKVVIK